MSTCSMWAVSAAILYVAEKDIRLEDLVHLVIETALTKLGKKNKDAKISQFAKDRQNRATLQSVLTDKKSKAKKCPDPDWFSVTTTSEGTFVDLVKKSVAIKNAKVLRAIGKLPAQFRQDHLPANVKPTLTADSADETDFEIIDDADLQLMVERQIRARRGQAKFRDALRRRYGDRCMVSGCTLVDVLEAAHIIPYRNKSHHHTDNGLLLRADIHTLFDLGLIVIDPESLKVEIDDRVCKDYGHLNGASLNCSAKNRPSADALMRRFKCP